MTECVTFLTRQVSDADVINFELALADIAQIERRLERLAKGRARTKEEQASQAVRLYRLMPLKAEAQSLK